MSDALVEKALERLARSADARVVFGDPVTAGSLTVIPVARVAYGFGGGFGQRDAEAGGDPESGGGGGGAVLARPLGAIEINEWEARFVEFQTGRKIAGAFLAGLAAGLVLAWWRR